MTLRLMRKLLCRRSEASAAALAEQRLMAWTWQWLAGDSAHPAQSDVFLGSAPPRLWMLVSGKSCADWRCKVGGPCLRKSRQASTCQPVFLSLKIPVTPRPVTSPC